MNPVKILKSKYNLLLSEYRQLLSQKNERIAFYNCWDQPTDEMYWFRYINHRHLLDNNKLKVAIFSVFGRPELIQKVNADVKIFYTAENLKKDRSVMYADHCLRYKDIDLSIGFELFDHPKYIRFPLWMDYMFDPEFTPEQIIAKCNSLRFPSIDKKHRYISFVASVEWDGLRKEMVDKISILEPVDCGGKYLHNDDSLMTECNDNKLTYLKSFYFNICPENDNAYGCVSEKIFEAILCGCIPIYWGSYNNPEPDVINKNAVIFWSRKDGGKSALKQIKELLDSPKLLNDFISQPRLVNTAEEFILDKFSDLEKKIESVIKNKLG